MYRQQDSALQLSMCCLQVPHVQDRHLNSASCAQPDRQMSSHQHHRSCAAAELEICLAIKEAAVADAAVAAVAKVCRVPIA